MPKINWTKSFCYVFVVCLISSAFAQPIGVAVDLTDAPRNIYHAKLTFPVTPGQFTLVYPKWIPGNHRPSGPISNLTGIKMEASGQSLDWQRDPIDMYAFHVDVPNGVTQLQVSLDVITTTGVAGSSGASASSNVLDLNWNQVVLYPADSIADQVQFAASVHLPSGWKFGTALPVQKDADADNVVVFKPVCLTTLVDSPLIAGDHYRQIQLTKPGEAPAHVIDMVSESKGGLQMSSQDQAAYRKLVAETGALFGARHYSQYHFLLTLSDEVGGRGLEHHESSDNAGKERTLTDPSLHLLEAGLLPHEFTHSWNGKYRRPAGLATKNYQDPMVGDLLWVYEGLTEYLGNVLTVRSGLWTPEQYREALAETAAALDHRSGRTWRPLEDTARSVQILRLEGPEWESWRRGLDYYPEGELIWLEVDTIIRQQSHGKKSLDDFCHAFHGGESGAPKVIPYTFDDLVQALNNVQPYDWAKLLNERVNSRNPHAPMLGIEQGGWKLTYNNHPNAVLGAVEDVSKAVDDMYSLGLVIKQDGTLIDVNPGSPAYAAGLAPKMKLIAVNERKWSPKVLAEALDGSGDGQVKLLIESANFFYTYTISYHDGAKYPHLERAAGPDVLDDILRARTQ